MAKAGANKPRIVPFIRDLKFVLMVSSSSAVRPIRTAGLFLITFSAQILTSQDLASAKCQDAAKEPEALTSLQAANQAYESDDFIGALREYQAAYALCHSEILLFGIANCENELGREADAARDFERFLREASDAEQELRREATEKLDALSSRLTAVTLAGSTSGDTIFVDQQKVGGWTAGRPLFLPPGRHTLRVDEDGGGRFERILTATTGGRLNVEITSAPALVAPSSPKLPEHHRWWLWGGIATVLVAGMAATYLMSRSDRPACPTICR